ncbi:glycosyltransferase family 39 protein [Flammeovirga sp. SJP92]|uniref:ArnT family glycosyltransferase n=1 Tax=Flammeovirga sp. SJP92 TaxID=1775430 RepID=UPI0007C75C44|nr:glycosyltransferase family 39 protein [Flammeovirga sp. SJP92]
MNQHTNLSAKNFLFLLVLLLIVNGVGLFHPIFNIDSALYACISKYIVNSNDIIHLIVYDKDWLDKPHFPFWVCALSMKLFGINSFAYKLPSFLFFCLGLYYTYQIAVRQYNKQVAQWSVLLTGTALHIILSNNDVRAEAILIGVLMGAAYYTYLLFEKGSLKNIVLASLFTAFAIMTKGIFILIIIYSALIGHALLNQKVKCLIKKRWAITLLLTSVFIAPELIALYIQFDMHPEKIIFDTQNVSGIQFFLWDSQFGRFFNSGPIKGNGDPFFFLHTLLWAFAPWALIGYFTLFKEIKAGLGQQEKEYYNLFGFVVIFILFSLSSFQLPHYTNIIFPFLSIITAREIVNSRSSKLSQQIIQYSTITYSLLFAILLLLIEFVYFDRFSSLGGLLLSIIAAVIFYLVYFKDGIQRYALQAVITTCIFGFYIHQVFYKDVLTYQGSIEAAEYINTHHKGRKTILLAKSWLMEFYNEQPTSYLYNWERIKQLSPHERPLIYCYEDQLEEIEEMNMEYTISKTFKAFHITILNAEFLQKKTRKDALHTFYLIDLQTPKNLSHHVSK